MKTKTLCFIAGLVWLIAGFNVCRIGVVSWQNIEATSDIMIIGCLTTLILFSVMFVKMVFKNVRRIQQIDAGRRRLRDMMSVRSYIIMAFMIALGIGLRQCPSIPLEFIASFYIGLGTALAIAGIIYITAILCPKKL